MLINKILDFYKINAKINHRYLYVVKLKLLRLVKKKENHY